MEPAEDGSISISMVLVISFGYIGSLYVMQKVIPFIYPEKRKKTHAHSQESSSPPKKLTTRFQSRPSILDSSLQSDSGILKSDFHGFLNLGAIGMLFFVLTNNVVHLLKQGTLIGLQSFSALFNRFEVFFLWGTLLLASFFCVVLQKIFIHFKVPRLYQRILHAIYMISIFSYFISKLWLHTDWPMAPKGSLSAELLVILMKIHSYLVNNRQFEIELEEKENKKKNKSDQRHSPSSSVTTASPKSSGSSNPPVDASPTDSTTEPTLNTGLPNPTVTESASEDPTESSNGSHQLPNQVDTPVGNKVDNSLLDEAPLVYPTNVTFVNFAFFLLVPTLVYELHYPRTSRVRLEYVVEKIFLAAGIFAFLHVISQKYIVPIVMESPNITPIEAVANLVIPIFFCYMLIFYLVFDCICNGFAELTRFADREFYRDWWNSTTMDEFARNWNKPVHEWLLRHIYLESMQTYRLSKKNATYVTFLFSSFLHEGYMIVCFRMFRPWLFVLQMAQLPLIVLGRDLKGTRLGNLMFWFAILLGIPLISVLYSREYFLALQLENQMNSVHQFHHPTAV